MFVLSLNLLKHSYKIKTSLLGDFVNTGVNCNVSGYMENRIFKQSFKITIKFGAF